MRENLSELYYTNPYQNCNVIFAYGIINLHQHKTVEAEGAKMFTIKVIEDDGSEFLKADVTTVSFNPPTEKERASLFVWYKDRPAETFYSGKIYVMNENGKTVANYTIYPIE